MIGTAGALLARWKPVLLVEFWFGGIDELGDRPIDVLSYYRSLGFSVSLVAEPGADSGWTHGFGRWSKLSATAIPDSRRLS